MIDFKEPVGPCSTARTGARVCFAKLSSLSEPPQCAAVQALDRKYQLVSTARCGPKIKGKF